MSIQTIMNADPSGKELVEYAHQVAKRLVTNGLTRSQIRTIFTEVRSIETLWDKDSARALRRLNMLVPKLAYQASREKKVELLRDELTSAIQEVVKAPEDRRNLAFQRFVDFFEAILAFHRAEGGRN